jgi:hypothetical protein
MFTLLRHRSSACAIAIAALLAGWAPGVGAQSTDRPLAAPAPAAQAPQQQAPQTYPPLPLGQDDVREVQNQLIALGFNPGAADGQAGPATQAAAQQYDQSRGGNGQVAIDSALLARLKADTAPRLSYDQVAARSRAAQAGAPASGASQIGGVIQQLAPLIGAAINSSNNNYGPYGYGGYPGPGYYGPPPVYYGYGYGGY